MSLPARFGGLGIFNPTESSTSAYDNSMVITEPLVDLIMRQEKEFEPNEIKESVSELRKQIDKEAEEEYKRRLEHQDRDRERSFQLGDGRALL